MVYILWLVLWAPNVVVSHVNLTNYPSYYTRYGSLVSALCDPLIFMCIDRRFLKVWKETFAWITHGRLARQVYPITLSNEMHMSVLAT